MALIHILDSQTIDQIAAGEVVERPSSVVKELVENSMDAGADAITVEIKDGGIELIRVTDNGCGILKEDLPNAFLRHATSKIRTAEDLSKVLSMGFRGEALGSIAAVAKVELISKHRDALMGNRYVIEGGIEKEFDEVGAPDGTTIVVRNLFYNTPARRKFLKTTATEGGYVADLMEHLAMSRPDISYTFIQNKQVKFSTSGNGDLKEVIYHIYGKDTAREIIPIISNQDGMTIEGYLGTPVNARSNRNFENYFINRRYIKSNLIAKGIEEGYKAYMMQHRFPFCVLHITMDTQEVDVNVHPSKMDVRFHDQQQFMDFIIKAVAETLSAREMIADCDLVPEKEEKKLSKEAPEPFERNRRGSDESHKKTDPIKEHHADNNDQEWQTDFQLQPEQNTMLQKILEPKPVGKVTKPVPKNNILKERDHIFVERPVQMELFDKQRVLSENSRKQYKIIGQIFDTYWLFELGDNLYFIDQHAAHEKVNYERLMKQLKEDHVYRQQLNPPIVVTVTGIERQVLSEAMEYFADLGFEIEEFGGNEYAIRTIPLELYLNDPKDMFLETLNELAETGLTGTPEIVRQKIATMACKASVKGNMKVSLTEIDALLDELLTLDNPYHCPHGRPTIFAMSRYDIEKKFKRIV
ncbi:MAG: DNA mismatch repair endonuclease MutL [Lachnospiraceae bacterium]|nr:DNA mismatch repair endonuclease MutL [Lachnospiraceae bacterium]